jgi:A/G-specific adenine glycosylase
VSTTQFQKRVERFHHLLRGWGNVNIKSYPWRFSEDPYTVLVSEIMLHRTNKTQAEKVFTEFIDAYPTLESFSLANQDDVKRVLNPLGLQWRINGMIKILLSFWETYREVPHEKSKLIKEENIGDYIAGATETFTDDHPNTLVDTNTVRVIGRVFGIRQEGEARRRKEMIDTIERVCDLEYPRNYYYALIDLAHEICTPKIPNCEVCPLRTVPCNFWKNR